MSGQHEGRRCSSRGVAPHHGKSTAIQIISEIRQGGNTADKYRIDDEEALDGSNGDLESEIERVHEGQAGDDSFDDERAPHKKKRNHSSSIAREFMNQRLFQEDNKKRRDVNNRKLEKESFELDNTAKVSKRVAQMQNMFNAQCIGATKAVSVQNTEKEEESLRVLEDIFRNLDSDRIPSSENERSVRKPDKLRLCQLNPISPTTANASNFIVQNNKDVQLLKDTGFSPSGPQVVMSSHEEDISYREDVLATEAALPCNLPTISLNSSDCNKLAIYWLDACEVNSKPGKIFLFGKVPIQSNGSGAIPGSPDVASLISCCVSFSVNRTIYALPDPSYLLEEAKLNLIDFLIKTGAHKVRTKIVKKNIVFHGSILPRGEYDWIECEYALTSGVSLQNCGLPAGILHVFGLEQNAVELFLLRHKLKGPCWLAIDGAQSSCSKMSWCKVEAQVFSHDCVIQKWSDISYGIYQSAVCSQPDSPPLVACALHIQALPSESTSHSHQSVLEIFAVSLVVCTNFNPDRPTEGWDKNLNFINAIRPSTGKIFPAGFFSQWAETSRPIISLSSERALLNFILNKIQLLDVDILIGHNLFSYDLEIFLCRLQELKVQYWSKIGRLRRDRLPRLKIGISGQNLHSISSAACGRIICDTYIQSKELVKEVTYSLGHLAKTHLLINREDLSQCHLADCLRSDNFKNVSEFIKFTVNDAMLSFSLACHLLIIPLTHQITSICGNLWSKTMQSNRAGRIEFLLLHEFTARNFIVPDKGNVNTFGTDAERLSLKSGSKIRKKARYSGGLVLEPVKGFHDKFVLLLDFNSLYPSIIQEFNIDFTTVVRANSNSIERDTLADIPTDQSQLGVMPQILRDLVGRRKEVKRAMKSAQKSKCHYQQLDIQQLALKLIANSMYGCLGFEHSRFYDRAIAELITAQGREILQSTVDLIQNQLGYRVIYGDTDSVMVDTGTLNLELAKEAGRQIKREVNKRYKLLEIELESIFRAMLLLKKKKYAALVVKGEHIDVSGCITFKCSVDKKGLDLVRRDWCPLAKSTGSRILGIILDQNFPSVDEVVERIHATIADVKEGLTSGRVPSGQFIITKGLSRDPIQYPRKENLPHVIVAMRMRKNGNRIGTNAGDHIPYIVCKSKETDKSDTPFLDRYLHPDEVSAKAKSVEIDITWYLEQQIMPVVSRLIEHVQGTSSQRIASILGLSAQKFQRTSDAWNSASILGDSRSMLLSITNGQERFEQCERLYLLCISCKQRTEYNGIAPLILDLMCSANEGTELKPASNFKCQNCSSILPYNTITNQLITAMRKHISNFDECEYVCDEEICGARLRQHSQTLRQCPRAPKCSGTLSKLYTQASLYNQLIYFNSLFDFPCQLENSVAKEDALLKGKIASAIPEEMKVFLIQQSKMIRNAINQSEFGIVSFPKIFSFGSSPTESRNLHAIL